MVDLNQLRDIDALKISLASPEEVLSWSYGEVTKPETINYRTFKPEKDGLFCEKIFGPVKDYECYCGKYKRIRYKGVVCDRCGVQVTTSKVRRERMGHIELASPVAHVWFFKNIPSVLATLLGIAPRSLELVIYFSSFVVTEIDYDGKNALLETVDEHIEKGREAERENIEYEIKTLSEEAEKKVKSLSPDAEDKWDKETATKAKSIRSKANDKIEEIRTKEGSRIEKAEFEVRKIFKKLQEVELYTVMNDREYIELEEYLDEFCEAKIGAEAVKTILEQLNVNKLAEELREELIHAKSTKADKIRKRLKIVDNIIKGGIDPRSMIVTQLPVIPPDLRPMVMLEGGRFATSDLNDLYRRIINRNNRLKRLLDLGAPDIIVRNEKRMLQEAVDALIDSSKVRRSRTRDRKTYRSLADSIKGKQGYFRANLLGKRVDYSGRAVIVSGPSLKMDECGLPTEMALELFRPFLIREIMARGYAPNMKTAKTVLDQKPGEVYTILEELVSKRPVLLNRAPTLHRLSIQAFKPKLSNGKAIQLHPVVVAGFNADFDGDQMAVHLPLSEKAVQEAYDLMISTKNMLKPADGSVMTIPSHEMVLGLYYLTSVNSEMKPSNTIFADTDEVLKAYGNNAISLRQPLRASINGEIIETTAGRVILNNFIPHEIGYINKPLAKSVVKNLIKETLDKAGTDRTVELIDSLKHLGFEYSTSSGVSLSIFDCVKPENLEEVLKNGFDEMNQIEQNYNMGLITKAEMSKLIRRTWESAIEEFDKNILGYMTSENPANIIITAGAGKASATSMRQISAVKGLVADPFGKILDLPILGNYANGMSSFDYFLTGRAVRRTYMDKGLGTADAGYLTRRLVNVAQDVLVRHDDCGTREGRIISRGQDTLLNPWHKRLVGRYAMEDVVVEGKTLTNAGEIITEAVAKTVNESKLDHVKIRSVLGCKTKYGVCARCYGTDLSTDSPVKVGSAVGIVAAQSIGEPGTQLTMKTFHSGGIAAQNITQGLPRIEELFEVRKPKSEGLLAMIAGKVTVEEEEDHIKLVIVSNDKDVEDLLLKLDPTVELLVKDGDLVSEGTKLTEGSLNLQDLYKTLGSRETQIYIVDEVQAVYGSQGVSIDDKHIEVIVRQMFNRVKVKTAGETNLLPGDIVTTYKLDKENLKVAELGGAKAEAKPVLLGISKVSRMSESWLDAASFEETASVLTDSAISGSIDELIGLKENVIIGRRIPVGEDARIEEGEK